MVIHQTKPFLLGCLEKVLDLNSYQFFPSPPRHILSQYTWHLLLVRLLLLQASPGFQRQGLRPYQSTHRLQRISPVPLALQYMAAIPHHNQLQIRHLSMEQFRLLQVYREEPKELSHQALEFVASFQYFPTETQDTFSARNSASSTSLKVAQSHGKSRAVKSNSPPLEQIAG
jgi:hypothetical protein